MVERYLPLLIVALLSVCAMIAPASAQRFSYLAYPSEMVFSETGGSSVLLPAFDAGGLDASGDGTDIVLTNLVLTHVASSTDTFNAPFVVQVRLADEASGDWTILDLDGRLNGVVSDSQTRLKVTMLEPTARVVQLGGVYYLLKLNGYSPPGRAGNDTHHGVITAHVTIPPVPAAPAVASFTFNPPIVKVGQFSVGTITLNQPAPFGGVDVVVVSQSPDRVAASYTVDVNENNTSVSFPVGAIGVGTASVQATYNGSSLVGTLQIKPSVCFDIDDSGNVDIADATRLLRVIAGLDPAPECR